MGSRSSTASRTEYNTTTQNLNLQGVDGIAVAGNQGPTEINVLDAGAVGRAFGFGSEALRTNERAVDSALLTTQAITGEALRTNERAVDSALFANSSAIEEALRFASESLGVAERSVGQVQRSFENALQEQLDISGEAKGGTQRIVAIGAIAIGAVVVIAIMVRK